MHTIIKMLKRRGYTPFRVIFVGRRGLKIVVVWFDYEKKKHGTLLPIDEFVDLCLE